MKISVIHEDKNILVLNKPAGLMVHSDGKTSEKTLADWLVKRNPSIKKVGEPISIGEKIIYRPGIVHRLDRETSGVILVAKNQKTFEELKKQFQERKVKKIYDAIVFGWPKEEKGRIAASIGRSAKFGKFIASRGKRGQLREAITDYRVVKKFTDKNGVKWAHLKVFPKTGRTHQIRVHFSYLNHPVAGDKLYGGKKPFLKNLPRLALHASEISFDLFGKSFKFTAPSPIDFQKGIT
jgi:23S rRNA pseudouridine1911/1915/1917 synthase